MHRPVTPNNPSRRPSNSSSAQDGEAYRTALRGASLAFQRTGPTSNGAATDTSRNNDKSAAMAAHHMSRQTTGNSTQDGTNHGRSIPGQTTGGQAQGTQNSAAPSLLKPPGRLNVATDPRATSFIAATLAASRSASPSPNHRPQARPSNNAQQGAPGKKQKGSPASSVTSLDLATDTMSIPPTNALISMFEKNNDGRSPSRNRDPIKKPNKPRPLTPPSDVGSGKKVVAKPSPSSPRQVRNMAGERLESPPALSRKPQNDKPQEAKLPPLAVKKKPAPLPLASKPLKPAADTNAESVQQAMAKTKNRASMPPQPASKGDTPILSPQPRRAASHKMVRALPPPEQQKEIPRKPAPPVKPKPQTRTTQESLSHPAAIPKNIPDVIPQPPIVPVSRHSTGSSDDTFVSASSVQTSRAPSPHRGRSPAVVSDPPGSLLRTRPKSVQSLATDSNPRSRNPAPPPPRRSQQPNNNMTLNHLTDATMAGILASRTPLSGSAAPSPRPPSVPPPRKKTPLMRQTLRKPRSDSSDEDQKWKARHKTKPLQSKKKHSHHEGARKRWREEITERERRRYEGVWASNRGRLLVSPDADTNGSPQPTAASSPANGGNGNVDLVVNIVVRDIWTRSRLPPEELVEVWDLVDSTGRGALTKVEFVVGMWLIDQRLKGRKIPQKVTDSVWTSARGVSVKGPPKDKGKVKHKH